MKQLVKSFIADEQGATAIEYGLIAALISITIITGATKLGNNIGGTMNNVSGKMKP